MRHDGTLASAITAELPWTSCYRAIRRLLQHEARRCHIARRDEPFVGRAIAEHRRREVVSISMHANCHQQRNNSGFHRPNENKMSDGGRGRASLGMEVWKSSQKSSVQPRMLSGF